ncbi:MAG: response regulator [Ignavibacteriales bacterium]|nr:response regulator [Ignavibacteriales bacterium]
MTQSQVAPTTTSSISVWLVDDNEEFCTVVSAALTETTTICCSQCFQSCEAAIESLKNGAKPPAVILLDIGLPGMSGIDGIRKLLDAAPMSKIVMLTGLDRDENIIRSLAEGATGYLSKTSSAEDLVHAITATVRGGTPIDPFTLQKLLKILAFPGFPKKSYDITPKEKQILHFVTEGLTIESIAENLKLSIHTVGTHLKHLYSKLDVHTRSALASKVLKERLF